jgi:hypothetical protein
MTNKEFAQLKVGDEVVVISGAFRPGSIITIERILNGYISGIRAMDGVHCFVSGIHIDLLNKPKDEPLPLPG